MMRIKIVDIPPEGRNLDFALPVEPLNARLDSCRLGSSESSLPAPAYTFVSCPEARLFLNLEGSTVIVTGNALGSYKTNCSRCVEETTKQVSLPIKVVLKPHAARAQVGEEDEDLNLGFYDGQEVDCAEFVEEFLLLGLPYTVLCSNECRGLCPICGANLNYRHCSCAPADDGDERFAMLRKLKIQ